VNEEMKFIRHLHELKASKWPCHASGGYSPASHHAGPGSTQASLCEIYGVQSGNWTGFPPITPFRRLSVSFSQRSTLIHLHVAVI